eukprot:TRINITY_DN260_c0_g3_i1.p1 TRINITY_DN260_c0_g3~~TRINITY_DN260_c0_g3_i1.p1  ORF type:complete len:687 (-),score=180.65 TRINITY_DN260_c0_g3_i1:115-2175(-)
MATPNRKASAKAVCAQQQVAWNHWLDPERERAPGDKLVEWLGTQASAGLSVLGEYAQAATSRFQVLSDSKRFLDEGGLPTQTAVLAKKNAMDAVAADVAFMNHLQTLIRINQEEGSFTMDASKKESCRRQIELYGAAAKLLGEGNTATPKAPTWNSALEQDAGRIMAFRLAKADLLSNIPGGNVIANIGIGTGNSQSGGASSSRQAAGASGSAKSNQAADMEKLMSQLFTLHDLNANGVLEEEELIKLNEKIAILHYGRDIDKGAVRQKFQGVFRDKLNASGEAVPYEVFRLYMLEVLAGLDSDRRAQVMILEQFCAEAESGREAFQFQSLASFSDEPFLEALGVQRLPPTPAAPSKQPPAAAAAAKGSATFPPPAAAQGSATFPPTAAHAGRPNPVPPSPAERMPSITTEAHGPGMGYFPSMNSSAVPMAPGDLGPPRKTMADTVAESQLRPPLPAESKASRDTMAASFASSASGDDTPVSIIMDPKELQPGAYTVVHKQVGVNPEPDQFHNVTHTLDQGARVNVLEIKIFPALNRVRGRLESPFGWISLLDLSDGFRWAEPVGATVDWRSSKELIPPPPPATQKQMPSMTSSMPSISSSMPSKAERSGSKSRGAVPMDFASGDRIQVWSNSQKSWLDGKVLEAFDQATFTEGYAVPAGSYKVTSAAGTKWIMTEQVAQLLRRRQ